MRRRFTAILLAAVLVGAEAAAQRPRCGVAGATTAAPRGSALCRLAERGRATRSDALLVLRGSEPVLEYRGPNSPDRIHVMSITKSVAALAVGRMLMDGTIDDLDLRVSEVLPEWRQGRKAGITLRHLLTHTSGIQDVDNAGLEIEPAPDAVQLAIAAELEADPGATFRYNNKAINLLAELVERRAAMPLDDYLAATVFRDLGITDFEWIRDPAGNPYVMAGLTIGAQDLAKIGRLMLQRGSWNGTQVVDEAFAVDAVTSQHDLYPRHGFLWWLLRDQEGRTIGYYGDGWLGQSLVVVSEHDLVAVRLIDRSSWSEQDHTFDDFRELVLAIAAEGSDLTGERQPSVP